jgi:hypothetical protein
MPRAAIAATTGRWTESAISSTSAGPKPGTGE